MWGGGLRGQEKVYAIPDSLPLIHPSLYHDTVSAGWVFGGIGAEKGDAGRLKWRLEALYYRSVAVHDVEIRVLSAHALAVEYQKDGELSKAFDWIGRATSADSLLPWYAAAHQHLMNGLGSFYGEFGAHKLALGYLRASMEISQKRDPYPGKRQFGTLSSYALCLQEVGEMDSGLAYSVRAIRTTEDIGDAYWHASALNNHGMALQRGGYLGRALDTLRLAEAEFWRGGRSDSAFLGAIRDNLGQVLREMGDLEGALRLFEDNIGRFGRLDAGSRRHVFAVLRAAETLVLMGRAQAADAYLRKAGDLRAGADRGLRQASYVPWMNCRIEVAEALGDWRGAAHLRAELAGHTDSLAGVASRAKIRILEDMMGVQGDHYRHDLEVADLKAAENAAALRYGRVLVVALLLGGGLVVVGLVALHGRRLSRLRHHAEQQRLQQVEAELKLREAELEQVRLGHELELRQRDITDLALDISLKRQVSLDLVERLKLLKGSANPVKDIQEMILALKSQVEGAGQVRLAPEHIDVVNHAFYERLRSTFPGLSASDLELCGLLRMQMGSKEIAALRNVTPHSVRISKSRLKKKLGLGPEDDLGAYLGGQ